MRIKTLSTSFKKEELLQLPHDTTSSIIIQEESLKREVNHHGQVNIEDEFDCINIEDDDATDLPLQKGPDIYGQLNYWDDCLMPSWGGFVNNNEEAAADDVYENKYFDQNHPSSTRMLEVVVHQFSSIKKEAEYAFLEEEEKKQLSLNLSLNYQEVLDAWSDRTLWADESSSTFVAANNNAYMGEVPVIEEERRRREASVLRYKEKRHTRLFSKKIRYQVRKLNADKRPRLRGRFVKRVAEKIHK
ncbi:hypothetical protein ACH5RR_020605 [Cinchona calisaya]|uniref:CCT domain-containing protein n=1 Tax=Cinchona calisaya TaxID=153742 RepID=A0ABD2ZEZ4_9GENT